VTGELFSARGAFALKGDAIRWAEEQRKDRQGIPQKTAKPSSTRGSHEKGN
jgi:hypothetical protein